MAQRRIKSFSPYTYNVQYRRPGEKPIVGKRAYIPNAGISLPEYVITKREEKEKIIPSDYIINYFTYVNNTFFYLINDDCEIEFLKYSSEFEFLRSNKKESYELCETFNVKYTYEIFDINKFQILSNNEIRINHNLNSIIDLIILNENKYFFDYSYTEEDTFNIKIKFNSDVDLGSLRILIYQIYKYDSPINRFKYTIFNLDDDNFSFDSVNNRYKIRNIFGTTRLKLKINSIIDNQIKTINSINVTPSYIFFDKNEIIHLNDLISQKEMIESQQFSNDSSLIETYNNINNQINQLSNKNNYDVDIKSIEIYYPLENFEKKYIQFGKSNEIISWSSDNENYYIDINHSLDGYVNYLIDNNEFKNITYNMIFVSNYKIRMIISKNDSIPLSFSLSLFKVGEYV